MNFEGYTPQVVPRCQGVVAWDNPAQLPLGLAQICRNARFNAESAGTRYGLTKRMSFGAEGSSVAGLGCIRLLPETGSVANQEAVMLLAYTATDGNIYDAWPLVQGSANLLTGPAWLAQTGLTIPTGINPIITQGFNRGYVALGSDQQGQAPPLVYSPPTIPTLGHPFPAGLLDQASDQPFGFTWTSDTVVRAGQVCSPSTFAGRVYRCIVGGTTGAAEPTWPTAPEGIVTEPSGTGVEWQENTPVFLTGLPDPLAPIDPTTTVDSGSPIINGATVFVALTYNNTLGEGINELTTSTGAIDTTKVLQWTNTTGSTVSLTVTMPAIPTLFGITGQLGAEYCATSFNVYVYIVPSGNPTMSNYTDPSYYAQVAKNLAPGATATISAYPTAQALPTVNDAFVSAQTGAGAIDVGIRYATMMFQTRTDYITGWNGAVTFPINVSNSGQQLLCLNLPIGAYNMNARIIGLTVAGASSAGPYTYVSADDTESPGFNEANIAITATIINDNTTTTALLNFTDTYLPGASDVTNYATRIQIPNASDVYFAKSLGCMVYSGCAGYPSGHLITDFDDPEAVRIPGSNLQVADTDGDRALCVREVREIPLSFKENGCYAIGANDGDPNTWAATPVWTGLGPCGTKAVDIWVDDSSAFIVFAHRSGLYLVQGSTPQLIARELIGSAANPGVWRTINWSCASNIKVLIDGVRREVRVMVPTGTSTTNDLTITLNYFYGWEDPVIFAQRSGKLVPNVNGRKWSLDDIAANDGIYLPQRYSLNETQELQGTDLNTELVFACADGALYTVTDGQYYDENWSGSQVGYLSQWVSVPGANPARNIMQLGGATWSGIGNGTLNVYAFDTQGNLCPLTTDIGPTVNLGNPDQPVLEVTVDLPNTGYYAPTFGIGWDNGAVPGAWWEVHCAILYLQQYFVGQL